MTDFTLKNLSALAVAMMILGCSQEAEFNVKALEEISTIGVCESDKPQCQEAGSNTNGQASLLTVPKSAYKNDIVNVSWEEVPGASYALYVALDSACNERVVALENISSVNQQLKLQNTGAFFVCLFIVQGDSKLSAKNSPQIIEIQEVSDRTPPTALTAFSAASGLVNDGDILLALAYPGDTSDYGKVDVRRIAGAIPPNSDCRSDGKLAREIPPPFKTSTFTDATGSTTGGIFSYRVCIRDAAGNLTSTNTAANIAARDSTSPLALAAFSATSGSVHGDISISLVPPNDSSDYKTIKIFRTSGSVAPATDCASGSTIYTSNGPFTSATINDSTGANFGEAFSYRACIYDAAGNLNAGSTVAGVRANDSVTPPSLAGFTGVQGSNPGEINLTVIYPADVSDYASVQIRRATGTVAPNGDCSTNGTVVYAASAPPYNMSVVDQTNVSGGVFSYRTCVFDAAANLTSGSTITSVTSQIASGNQNYTVAGVYTFEVPALVTSMTIKAWGGGGAASSVLNDYGDGNGGGGGYATGILTVTPGETLSITVGSGGRHYCHVHQYPGSTWVCSGGPFLVSGYVGPADFGGPGPRGWPFGEGGGYSGVFRSATPYLIAGGGGTGGVNIAWHGGVGGGTSGGDTSYVTTGGSQTAGGTASSGNNGSYLQGAVGWGGGYYGGGGDSWNSFYVSGGGGGSSYGHSSVTDYSTTAGSGQTVGNNGEAGGSVGLGGLGSNANFSSASHGFAGRVLIQWGN